MECRQKLLSANPDLDLHGIVRHVSKGTWPGSKSSGTSSMSWDSHACQPGALLLDRILFSLHSRHGLHSMVMWKDICVQVHSEVSV